MPSGQFALRFVELADDAPRLAKKAAPLVSQCHSPGGSVKQDHTQARLKFGNAAGDCGRRDAQFAGRGSKASAIGDSHEHFKRLEPVQ